MNSQQNNQQKLKQILDRLCFIALFGGSLFGFVVFSKISIDVFPNLPDEIMGGLIFAWVATLGLSGGFLFGIRLQYRCRTK